MTDAAPGLFVADQPAEQRPSQTSSLYRLYRPQSFDSDELVGQEHIVRTLQNAIRRERVAHAYLFCGPRGTGKTTTARILAKAVNCLDPDPAKRPCNVCAACVAINTGATSDVIEIDAASNRGIDDIRDLRERVLFAPTQLKTKFYIIDEAHQITGAAANAFLKTLEEPPQHVKFVLATTDPEELLPTIVSRCQRFDFRRLSVADSARRIRTVADREAIKIDDGAVELLGELGRGSLRDALGMLDQLASFDRAGDVAGERAVSVDDVRGLLGVSRSETVIRVATAIADRDASQALTQVNQVVSDGLDPRQLNRELAGVIRELLQRRAGARLPPSAVLDALAERFTLQQLLDIGKIFSESDSRMRHAVIPQMPLELSLVEAILGLGTAAANGQTSPPYDAPIDQPDDSRAVAEGPRPRPSLRDAVRQRPPGGDAGEPTTPAGGISASHASNSAPSRRPASSSPPASVAAAPAGKGDGVSLEWLVEEWPRIRNDVKAVDRRVEALLSQADPHAVIDDLVVLSAPYQFHRDQLNKDDKRVVVEDVVSRRAGGRRYRMTCIDRNDGIASLGGGAPVARPAPEAAPTPWSSDPTEIDRLEPETPATAPSLSLDEQRIRAAASIFDAEVIDESTDPASRPASQPE